MPTPAKTLTRPLLAAAAAAIAIAAGMSLAAAPAQANGCITNVAGVSDGSAAHPFLIENVENLECMRTNSAYWAAGKYFKQTADIDLSGENQELTIGTDGTPFRGNYDGGGKKIIGLRVSASGSSAGLFGKTNGATLSNLTLENASVSIPETEYASAGALVGWADNATEITNVHSSGTVAGVNAGGVVGSATGNFSISYSTSAAAITGYHCCAGGLVGSAGRGLTAAVISDSSASGAVNGGYYVGGLVGAAWAPTTITRSFSTGAVTAFAGYVGGLVGVIESSSGGAVAISKSFATGNVTSANDGPAQWAGGLVGVSNTEVGAGSTASSVSISNSITDSYSTGVVSGGVSAGGVLGMNWLGTTSIENTYSRSAVRGPTSASGGLLGLVRDDPPSPSSFPTPLGVVKDDLPVFAGSFWNPTDADNANANANAYGTQSTQAAMKTAAPYSAAGWDIAELSPATKTWLSCPTRNDGYPFLQWYGTLRGWTCDAPAPPDPTPPDPTPPAPTPPGPTPKPSNAFILTQSGSSISSLQSVITTSGPGVAQQRGSFSSLSSARSAKALTACTGSRKLAKAGRYTLGCKLTSAVRSARRRGSVRVLLRTTFTPTGGAARTITRIVTLKKTSSGVTG